MSDVASVSVTKSNLLIYCIAEDANEGNALNAKTVAADVVQVKEEKAEEEEQPVSKKRRNEGRSQRGNKAKPVVKEESEGDASLVDELPLTFLFV